MRLNKRSVGVAVVVLLIAFGAAFAVGRGLGAAQIPAPATHEQEPPLSPDQPATAAELELPAAMAEQVPAYAQPHVLAVGRYFHTAVRSKLARCLADVKPNGAVRVRHHFVVEERKTSPSVVAVHALQEDGTPAFEITHSDVGDSAIHHVERCLSEATQGAEFAHVPVHPGAPRDPFVTFQVYEFQSPQPKE